MALGVAGFLVKGDDPDALLDRIRAVAGGGSAWNPAAAQLSSPSGQLQG
jgi:DNA-binding NarL/FixJ family response regulator